jgi:hypothetical protein
LTGVPFAGFALEGTGVSCARGHPFDEPAW